MIRQKADKPHSRSVAFPSLAENSGAHVDYDDLAALETDKGQIVRGYRERVGRYSIIPAGRLQFDGMLLDHFGHPIHVHLEQGTDDSRAPSAVIPIDNALSSSRRISLNFEKSATFQIRTSTLYRPSPAPVARIDLCPESAMDANPP